MIDFQQINRDALSQMPGLLPALLPGGKAQGREYVFGDLAGTPGQSSSVNMETGQWADFATGDKGGDPVSLVAAIYRIPQGEAAMKLAEMIGCTNGTIDRQTRAKSTWETLPASGPPKSIMHPKHGKPSATWKYYSSDALLIGLVCRFDHGDGSKDVIPFTHGHDSKTGKTDFMWRSFSEPRPLYGLDRLAQRLDKPVLVVEGEKAVDAGQRLIAGAVVITWPGGSSAVSKADWSPLKGRRLAIWPDADEPGRKAAEAVALQAVKAGAAEVYIVDIPSDKEKGWDVADAEAEGWTSDMAVKWIKDRREKFQTIREDAGNYEVEPANTTSDTNKKKIVPVNITDFLGLEFPPRENLMSPWLPSQGLVMLYAGRGIGKTYLALGVAYAVTSGGAFLGWQAPSPAGVLYIDGEMPGIVMQERLGAIIMSNQKEPVAPFILLTPDLQPEGMSPHRYRRGAAGNRGNSHRRY